jgi:hypothetical protein
MKPKDKNMDLSSSSNNIQHTAQLIMDAFRHFGTRADEVLSFDDLLPYLEAHSDQPQHYKDSLKEAEYHLTKTAYAIPDPVGLRLTQVGFEALQEGKAV